MDHEYLCGCSVMPVLYYDALSSQARSCYMLVKMLKIDVELRPTDSIHDVNFNETYTWINSFCMLPFLVDGAVTLCNGQSILIYLCKKYAPLHLVNTLCPCDYISRLQIMSVFYYEGCVLYRCLNHLLADIFLAKYPNFNVDYHKSEVSNIYHTLNEFLKSHFYMVGNSLSIADISLLSTISALNIIFPIHYGKFTNLFDWFQRLKKMEFYEYNEEGVQKLRYLLGNVGRFPFPSPFINEPKSDIKNTNNESHSLIQELNAEEVTKKVENKESHSLIQEVNVEDVTNKIEEETTKSTDINPEFKDNTEISDNVSEVITAKEIRSENVNETKTVNSDKEHKCCSCSPVESYTSCDCCYSGIKQTDQNSAYDDSENALDIAQLEVLPLKHVKSYNDINTADQDSQATNLEKNQSGTESKQKSCSCCCNSKQSSTKQKLKTNNFKRNTNLNHKNKSKEKSKKFDYTKNCENNRELNKYYNREETDKVSSSTTSSSEDIEGHDTANKNRTSYSKYKTNQQSDFIIRDINKNIAITKRCRNRENYEIEKDFSKREFQDLLAKVRSLEKILENSKCEMSEKSKKKLETMISMLHVQESPASLEQFRANEEGKFDDKYENTESETVKNLPINRSVQATFPRTNIKSNRNSILHKIDSDYSLLESFAKEQNDLKKNNGTLHKKCSIESSQKSDNFPPEETLQKYFQSTFNDNKCNQHCCSCCSNEDGKKENLKKSSSKDRIKDTATNSIHMVMLNLLVNNCKNEKHNPLSSNEDSNTNAMCDTIDSKCTSFESSTKQKENLELNGATLNEQFKKESFQEPNKPLHEKTLQKQFTSNFNELRCSHNCCFCQNDKREKKNLQNSPSQQRIEDSAATLIYPVLNTNSKQKDNLEENDGRSIKRSKQENLNEADKLLLERSLQRTLQPASNEKWCFNNCCSCQNDERKKNNDLKTLSTRERMEDIITSSIHLVMPTYSVTYYKNESKNSLLNNEDPNRNPTSNTNNLKNSPMESFKKEKLERNGESSNKKSKKENLQESEKLTSKESLQPNSNDLRCSQSCCSYLSNEREKIVSKKGSLSQDRAKDIALTPIRMVMPNFLVTSDMTESQNPINRNPILVTIDSECSSVKFPSKKKRNIQAEHRSGGANLISKKENHREPEKLAPKETLKPNYTEIRCSQSCCSYLSNGREKIVSTKGSLSKNRAKDIAFTPIRMVMPNFLVTSNMTESQNPLPIIDEINRNPILVTIDSEYSSVKFPSKRKRSIQVEGANKKFKKENHREPEKLALKETLKPNSTEIRCSQSCCSYLSNGRGNIDNFKSTLSQDTVEDTAITPIRMVMPNFLVTSDMADYQKPLLYNEESKNNLIVITIDSECSLPNKNGGSVNIKPEKESPLQLDKFISEEDLPNSFQANSDKIRDSQNYCCCGSNKRGKLEDFKNLSSQDTIANIAITSRRLVMPKFSVTNDRNGSKNSLSSNEESDKEKCSSLDQNSGSINRKLRSFQPNFDKGCCCCGSNEGGKRENLKNSSSQDTIANIAITPRRLVIPKLSAANDRNGFQNSLSINEKYDRQECSSLDQNGGSINRKLRSFQPNLDKNCCCCGCNEGGKNENLKNSSSLDTIATVAITPRRLVIPKFSVNNDKNKSRNSLSSNEKSDKEEHSETNIYGKKFCTCSKNLTTDIKRLDAGSNPKYQESKYFKNSWPISSCYMQRLNKETDVNGSDTSEEIIKIIYHFGMKGNETYKCKTCCNDCVRMMYKRTPKSKIPRLIAKNRMNDQITFRLTTRDIGCNCPRKESLEKLTKVN